MTKANLKLIKSTKKSRRYRKPRAQRARLSTVSARRRRAKKFTQLSVQLTSAEVSEAARFKAMVAARAAQKVMVRRIMAELEQLDDLSSAA